MVKRNKNTLPLDCPFRVNSGISDRIQAKMIQEAKANEEVVLWYITDFDVPSSWPECYIQKKCDAVFTAYGCDGMAVRDKSLPGHLKTGHDFFDRSEGGSLRRLEFVFW